MTSLNRAAVHAHPLTATGFAVAGEEIPANLLPELIFLVGDVPIVPYGTSGTHELGDRVVPYLEGHDALLLEALRAQARREMDA